MTKQVGDSDRSWISIVRLQDRTVVSVQFDFDITYDV